MSDGKKAPFGPALKKQKRLKKLANLESKGGKSGSVSILSEVSSAATFASDFLTDGVNVCADNTTNASLSSSHLPCEEAATSIHEMQQLSETSPFLGFSSADLLPQVHTPSTASKGSPFFGFMPELTPTKDAVQTISKKVRAAVRIFFWRPSSHKDKLVDVSGEYAAVKLISTIRSSTPPQKSVDVSVENVAVKPVSTIRSSNPTEKSVDVSEENVALKPISSIRSSTTQEKSVDVSGKCEALERISPFRSSSPKIKSVDVSSECISPFRSSTLRRKSVDPPMTPTLPKRKSIDFSSSQKKLSQTVPDFRRSTPNLGTDSFEYKSIQMSETESSGSSSCYEDESLEMSHLFFKIQVYARSEYDYIQSVHECCCMSMVALLYSAHKIIYDWDAHDLKCILDMGHKYFNETIAFYPPNYHLQPADLVRSLTIFDNCYDIELMDVPHYGMLDEEGLSIGFAHLDEIGYNLAILIMNEMTYGVVICRFENSVQYVLFDCHGRNCHGESFGELTVILFFEEITSLIQLLSSEFCHVNDFELYGINFRLASNVEQAQSQLSHTNDLNDISPPKPITPRPTIEDFPLIPGQQFYKKVFGTFCQFLPRLPKPHHQCTAMSAAALAHNSIKSASDWNSADLDAVLLAGQTYYNFNLEHLRLQNNNSVVSNSQSYLEAIALTPYLEIGELSFTVTVCNDDLIGGFHDDRSTLTNAIAELERKKLVTSVITYRLYSYGLIRCARENTESSYIFFDSHGRALTGRRPGDLSALLFFNNANEFISFFLSEFPLLKKERIRNEGDRSRMILLTPLIITCNSVDIPDNDFEELINDPERHSDHDGPGKLSPHVESHKIDTAVSASKKHIPVQSKQSLQQQQATDSYQFIRYDLYADEKFYDILICADTEEEQTPHSNLCVLTSLFAAIYDIHVLIVDKWEESDLEAIYEQSAVAYDYICLESPKNGTNSPPSDIFDICQKIEFGDGDEFTIVPKTERMKAVNVHKLQKILTEFSLSMHKYGILTICDHTYAVILCNGQRGRIALYDIHGRTECAGRIGKENELFSAVIYFVDVRQLIRFLLEENEMEFLVHFYPIKIEKKREPIVTPPVQETHLFHNIIMGRLAQNDVTFSKNSRNNQCTANSVVFLAYTSLITNNWTPTDIDRILYTGDHVYAIAYPIANKKRPRNNAYISAEEVCRKIVLNTDGLRGSETTVISEPVMELSGNVGKFAYSYIQRFFSKQIYGVFISSQKSVALYRFPDTYVLFDPHARNSEGNYHAKGTANIFFFANIQKLYQFLMREFYSLDTEFTLTAFSFRKEHKANRNERLIPPIVNLQNWNVPDRGDDFDYDDDIPLINLSNKTWSPYDHIPLIHLRNVEATTSANVSRSQPQSCSSKKSGDSNGLETMSMPKIKRDGSSFIKPSILSRTQRQQNETYNSFKKRAKELLPDEEQEIRRRWRNYSQRCDRAKFPRDFKNAQEYANAVADYKKRFEGGADDEQLIDLADAAVATVERNEERIRQQLHNRQLNPSHFLAFCNHENVVESDEAYNEFKLSPMNQVCQHCNALYFLEARNAKGIYTGCCSNGKFRHNLPEQQNNTYPYLLRNLLIGDSPLTKHFLEYILQYNNVFSFGSLGASDFSHMDRSGRLGVAVKVHGIIYHNAEYFRTNTSGDGVPPAQLYYIDNAAAVNERNNLTDVPLNVGLLRQIEVFLRANNPYAGAYRMLTEVLREVRNRPNAPPTNVNLQIFQVRHADQVNIRRNHGGDFAFPTANEVAAVFTDPPEPGTKNIVIFPSDTPIEGGIPIASADPNRDSYLYPLLFPFGEQTWTYRLYRDIVNAGDNARFRITARDFYSFILKTRHGMFSPLLNAGKLTQQFIIDAWSRVQENQMEYMKSVEGQSKLRAETYGALQDYIENSNIFKPDLPGRVIPMPVNFVGSRRYIKEKYLDAMAVCSKYKRPTYFITFTCNPFCKDIVDNIRRRANPVDGPEITSRVFQLYVEELVDDIKKKHVLGVCQALIYVIEWQKRANHHCHMIVFIQEEDRPANAVDIDNVVSAEIPCPVKQPRLYKAVTTYMYHEKCGAGSDAPCMVPRKNGPGNECKKNYPKKFAAVTQLTEGAPPTYRRRANGRSFVTPKGNTLDNRWIVPYNPYLLLKYNCHLNVEVVSTVDVLKYLFKYFYKGYDRSKIKLSIIDGEQVYDEFEHYVDCRHLTATEAYWRIASFPIHYNDHTVYRLPVHLENYQRVIINTETDAAESLARSGSELMAYFKLNQDDPNARRLLYTEIPYEYVYDTKTKSWHTRKRTYKPLVTRLYAVNYNQIELYALRLLLFTVKGARSYEEIRQVDGIQHGTFHSAAVALGLLSDDDMQHRTFQEICHVEMPYQIRCLFANLLLFITPNDSLDFWNKYKKEMCADYVRRKYTETMAEQLALRHISALLTAGGSSNTAMKLPEPHFDDAIQQAQADAVASEHLNNRYDRVEEQAIAQNLVPMLNDYQKRFYDRFMHCVDTENEQKLFFLDGPGGTGKTFLNRTILSTLRGMGKVCTVVVWTGIGASLYKGGRTAHSTFHLPFDSTGPVTCNISTTSDAAAELRQTDVFIWDEISMVNKHAFNAVDQLFRELKEKRTEPFGGIIVSTAGDFRQTLPILPRTTRSEIVNNLVKKSNSWQFFEKHALHINMRLADPNDIAFSAWLLDVGDGKKKDFPPNCYYDSYVKLPDECVSAVSLVTSIYGESFNSCDIRNYCQYALLSTHNEDVDMLNTLIYNRMTEDVCTEKTYYSTDSIANDDPNNEELYDASVLNNLNPKGTAPHQLVLKENCIISLLRNLNPFDGFCNGTRLLVKKLYQNCIVGEIISGENAGKVILIPRIRMTAKVDSISEELLRIQFPVKLCFAMTIDKSQSQSFESVGLFLRKPPFSHGQLYVALSRTRHKANLKIQVFSDCLMGKMRADRDDIYVPNIVYHEAL